MNAIQFAMLVNYLSILGLRVLEDYEMKELLSRFNNSGDEARKEEIEDFNRMIRNLNNEIYHLRMRVQPQINIDTVNDLLCAMQDGRKMDAIKAYRVLTGQYLKESKDAIERYWNPARTTV